MLFRVNTSMNKFYVFGLALLFTVALAGCGGGGGTADTGTGPGTTPDLTPAEQCVEDGGRVEDDDSCTPAADVASEKVVADTKAAGTKADAIGEEAGRMTDAGIGGRDEDGAAITGEDSVYTLEVSRDADGITAKVEDPAMGGDDDPKFAEAMAFVNGSMQVRTMEADDDGNVVEEVVVVRTDIAAPKATKFTTVHPINMETGVNTNMDNDTAGEDGTGVTYEALTVDVSGNPAEDAAILKLVMAGAFVPGAGSSTELTFARARADSDANTLGAQKVAAFETAGTYDGADGTYKCNAADSGGSDCSVTLNAKGVVTEASEGWIFTPADDAKVDVDDSSYLTYGFWLKRTTDADGATTYNEVETFATAEGMEESEDGSSNTQIGSVTGTATYEGGAAGVYVKNVTDNAGATVTATAGQFEAKVELNASFGGGGVAANNQYTISGEVTDFTLHPTGGTSPEANDWGVSLNLADFSGRAEGDAPGKTAPGTGTDRVNTFDGTATGDSTAIAGTWNGAFWGAAGSMIDHDGDSSETDATDPINQAPSAVTGEFNANFTDGTAGGRVRREHQEVEVRSVIHPAVRG